MPEIIESLIEGGKASAAPPLGPSLGPLGVNIGEVINSINEKTQDFKGMKVPVKITVMDDKSFSIEVGTPPVSQLIKKELKIEKGSGIPDKEKVGNLAIEQVIKIAKMKKDSMFVNTLKAGVKTVAGSANSMGILIEGKTSSDLNLDIEAGKFDDLINNGTTELSEEKKKLMQQQLEGIQEELQIELEKIKAQEEAEKAAEEAKKAEVAEEEKPEEKAEDKAEEKVGEKAEEKTEEKKEEKK